jgi:2-polyprenyl-3-methyl-5-hydroxy-6-metoxy-1,4-benzoquinol methylase
MRSLRGAANVPGVPFVSPVWPLPIRGRGWSARDVQQSLDAFREWHYDFRFEGGIGVDIRYRSGALARPTHQTFQRFAHFIPPLCAALGGSLAGRRVLDIACNAGFWSIQCALLGAAEVVGFDGRPELVRQARLLQSVVGVENARFECLDFFDMTPERLGRFDVVLNLGVLYHLPEPVAALRRSLAMASRVMLLDTMLDPRTQALVKLRWEPPLDARCATRDGIVAYPTAKAVWLMLRHLGAASITQIPVRSEDVPRAYLERRRASWLVTPPAAPAGLDTIDRPA